MPTANANTGNGFSKAISYALQEAKKFPDKERAEVLELNQVYGSSKEMGKQMREVADDRKTVQKPVLHVQINFHPDEKLTRAQAEKAIDSILKDVGIEKDNHQYVVVQHKDKAHDHYHVVANRVGMDGELLNDHRIKDRLQVACDKVEKEQDLRQTENRTVIYDPSKKQGYSYVKAEKQQKEKIARDKNPKIKEMKNDIQREISEVLAKKEIHTPEQLESELKKKGIDVNFSKNSNGISGVSFKKDDIAMKGTAIGYKWNDIKTVLDNNRMQSQKLENVNPHRLKSFLSEHMEKKMSLYVQNHSKAGMHATVLADDAVRTHMRELKPTENPWKTWEEHPNAKEVYERLYHHAEKAIKENEQKGAINKNEQLRKPEIKPNGKPQPSKEELKEMIFVEYYNKAVKSSISEFKNEINKNISCNADQIFEKNGFIKDQQHYVFKREGYSIKIDRNNIHRPQMEVINRYTNHKEREKNYLELMQEKPKEIGLLDKITGKAKEIKLDNRDLEQRQKQAKKPEFQPDIRLNERDFEKTASFTLKEAEWERKQAQEKIRENAKEHSQEKGQGRSRGRGI